MKLKVIFASLRAPFFTGTVVPVILGSILAWHHGFPFEWGLFWLTLLGAVALHAGANTINDYFDHLSGNDPVNREFVRPFSGGSRLIQNGELTARGMLKISLVCYLLGIAIGLVLTYLRGMAVFWIGLTGVACGVFYVAPGIHLVRRGLGELAIALAFGVCCVTGAYYVQAQRFGLEVFWASLPVALLITAVLWINEFPDFNADREVGKNHWVVRLGRKRAAWGYGLIMLTTYLLILGLSVFFNKVWLLLGLLTAPVAFASVRNALKNYDNIPALVPSNAGTIITHLLTGLLLATGYLLQTII